MEDILQYLINLSIFIPFIVILMVISIRFSKTNLENIGIYKYTKIIERTNLTKDTDVFTLKIGDEGVVIVTSPSSIEKIKDLDKEEVIKIEEKIKEMKNVKLFNMKNIKIDKLTSKLSKLNLKENNNGDIK